MLQFKAASQFVKKKRLFGRGIIFNYQRRSGLYPKQKPPGYTAEEVFSWRSKAVLWHPAQTGSDEPRQTPPSGHLWWEKEGTQSEARACLGRKNRQPRCQPSNP